MRQSIYFQKKPVIISNFAVGGPKESKGPLGGYLDLRLQDDKNNQDTYERSESLMQEQAIRGALQKAGKKESEIGALISGDLINEIIASSFAASKFEIPYLGVYNACSTFGEAIIIGSTMISGGFLKSAVCVSSSHFSSIERQFRYPLELGTQPTPTSQWTVTGAGCALLSIGGEGPRVDLATIGKIVDKGIDDANNMGGAMAPAAVDTVIAHLKDTERSLSYYDYIFTGDLGRFGKSLFVDLMGREGYSVGTNYNDCGAIIYGKEDKKSLQGGSGAGCVATVFNSYLISLLKERKGVKMLLVPTGALLSKVSSLQGETIPCIAHAIAIES